VTAAPVTTATAALPRVHRPSLSELRALRPGTPVTAPRATIRLRPHRALALLAQLVALSLVLGAVAAAGVAGALALADLWFGTPLAAVFDGLGM
jgi:hypothetical protein